MTKPAPSHTIPCPKCDGGGTLPDPRVTGGRLRLVRKKARVGLRELARELDLSAPYIHDLECGARGWTAALVDRYEQAVKNLTKP